MTVQAHQNDIASSRASTREELERGTFDLLVIGGGILGTSVAWTATQAGLRVAMVDSGDFAGATSSASSKLVHGGLRYLQTGNVRLVAENHKERRSLASDVAPHLVNPMPFLVPIYKDGPHGAAKMGAGVFLYSALSAFGDGMGRLLSPAQARRLAPGLRTDGLKSVAAYSDHQMNDSRMAVMTVRAAVDAGAVVLNHAEVVGLRNTHGRVTGADLRDRVGGQEFGIDARLVLNATGPWVDRLRRMEDPGAAPSVRLSKGAHLVLKTPEPWRAALTIPVDKYRVSFAIPWEGRLLLGTTDEEFTGDPADVGVVQADVDQILGEAAVGIDAPYLDPAHVGYSFAGLRVLPGGSGDSSTAKRETVVTQGRGGMLSVAGGKWTTYRHIGRTVLEELRRVSAVPLAEDMADPLRTVPLPGLASPDAVAQRIIIDRDPGARMDPLVARHLASHYGSLAMDIAALVRRQPELGERLHPEGPDIRAQVVFARDHEWAVTADDVLRRRTTVTVRGLDTPEVRRITEELLQS
ncbi:glycerol-3-phosphate dehydrogenase [Nocardiopsis sp. Huas11]|uniref:glycerol-3-phosphate dehydrogenase/oxidase n=1 Tax=Nocardiopsis sp. Huas11 TaxID=2183912 RepID=UPI000EB1AD56|nr:glycerol-3-phosphate dehydrogenase/oxidase [Nocardiopsis sp. Huas11]RKS05242.1 glycerol-3-phosphate dehydrogenase [Nocardiopsis sp. Huas11]